MNNTTRRSTSSASSHSSPHSNGIGRFRRYLPQVLASAVRGLVLLGIGMSLVFPTMVIPELTNVINAGNSTEVIHLTASQSSWFGSLGLIFELVGSLLAGVLRESLGYKYSLIIVNVPICFAWLLLYYATEVWHVFVGNAMLGFTAGLIETPAVTYVGEICEPVIRGILSAVLCIGIEIGIFAVFFIGSVMEWRQTALVCMIVPITTTITALIVPDAPIWLLSKDRQGEAQRALQWLRGWAPAPLVQAEFEQLRKYKELSHACDSCLKANRICPHPPPTFSDKISSLSRKNALDPLFLIVFMFFIGQFIGLDAMRTYLVQIMAAYGTPFDPKWATTLTEVAAITGILILLCSVHHVGKRIVYLISLTLTILSCLSLSVYGFVKLPPGWNSFESHAAVEAGDENYFPFFVLVGFALVANMGVIMIPWILMCEVFPLRVRGFASGLSGATNYIFSSVSVKFYYNLELSLSMPGVALLYAIIGTFGFLVIYLILPETEGYDLEEIELFYSSATRKLTDRKILKKTEESRHEMKETLRNTNGSM